MSKNYKTITWKETEIWWTIDVCVEKVMGIKRNSVY